MKVTLIGGIAVIGRETNASGWSAFRTLPIGEFSFQNRLVYPTSVVGLTETSTNRYFADVRKTANDISTVDTVSSHVRTSEDDTETYDLTDQLTL